MIDSSGDRHYRRGIVLGLTLAETFLLLLFVLLLVLSLRLLDEIGKHAEIQEQFEESKKRLGESEETVTTLSEQLNSLASASDPESKYSHTLSDLLIQRDQLQKETDILKEKTDELRERSNQAEKQLRDKTDQLEGYQAIERGLGEAGVDDYSPGQIAKALEGTKEVLELKHAIGKAGLPTDPDKLAEALEGTEEALELKHAIGEAEFPTDPDKLAEALKGAEEALELKHAIGEAGLPTDPDKLAEALREKDKELDSAVEGQEASKQRLDYFKRRHGLSNELPTCWIHSETSQAEYIFDTSLQSNGLMLHERILPHREADKKQLPMASIRYQLMMDRQEFKAAVLPLWKWSEVKKCRFHVRMFDYTGEQEKERYKNLRQTLESFFYIYPIQDNATTQPGEVKAP